MKPPFSRILVAVDAFAEEAMLPAERLIARVADLAVAKSCSAKLVYILTPSAATIPEGEFEKWSQYYTDHAKQNLEKLAKKLPAVVETSTHVIVDPSSSLRNSADRLLQFAIEEKSDLLVVQTHARTAPERFFLGSFAETLILQSRIPTLVINPAVETRKLFESVLFATDLSEKSANAFDLVAEMAKVTEAELTLYSRVPPPYVLIAPPGVLADMALERACREHREKACIWAERASQRGVRTTTDVCELSGSLSNAIVSHATENGASLIVVGNNITTHTLMPTGRIARQVARKAPCPVLILPIQGLKGLT